MCSPTLCLNLHCITVLTLQLTTAELGNVYGEYEERGFELSSYFLSLIMIMEFGFETVLVVHFLNCL